MNKLLIECYTRKDCSLCNFDEECALCNEALDIIAKVGNDVPFEFKEVDIDASEELRRRYGTDIPTVFINGKKTFKFKVDEAEFRKKVRKELIKDGISRLSSKKPRYT